MGVSAKVLLAIEIILKIALTGAFILALVRSILNLSRGLTTRRNFVEENSHFPAVTFCPFTYVSSRDGAVNTQNVDATFKDALNLPKISDFIEVKLIHKQFYEDPLINYTKYMYVLNNENTLESLGLEYREIWTEFFTTKIVSPYGIIRCATVNLNILNMSIDYYNEAIIQVKNGVLQNVVINFHDTSMSFMNKWSIGELHRIKLVQFPFPVSHQDLHMRQIRDVTNCKTAENHVQKFTCVEQYIQWKLNCNVPLSPIYNSTLRNCSTAIDVQKFINLTTYFADGYYDAELTDFGCLPENCIRNEWYTNQLYHVQPGQNSSLLDDLGRTDASTLILSKYSNRVTIEEEYYLYTLDSFIADIGGYLGLFLGASLLSSLTQLLHILTCAHQVEH